MLEKNFWLRTKRSHVRVVPGAPPLARELKRLPATCKRRLQVQPIKNTPSSAKFGQLLCSFSEAA